MKLVPERWREERDPLSGSLVCLQTVGFDHFFESASQCVQALLTQQFLQSFVYLADDLPLDLVASLEQNLDGWFRFRFRWCLPTGQTLLRGTDFGRMDSDGRFELIVVFLDPTEKD